MASLLTTGYHQSVLVVTVAPLVNKEADDYANCLQDHAMSL